MSNAVELKNVTYSYPNGFKAVENINITIEKGEKVAIIGQNGAGKTTTVKMMNGLLRPQEGKVIINGVDTADKTTASISRSVGYVFQNPGDQLFNSSVYNEIAFALKAQGDSDEEIDRKVRNAARVCHIDEYLETNPYDLPFSMRKFVTIAIVIANDCDIVILDEPTAGQDLFGIQWLNTIINDLNSQGKTVITITHDMDFVIDNFKHIIVMAHKNVIDNGSINDIFWNFETLKDANLRLPVVAELVEKLGVEQHIVSIDEFVDSCHLFMESKARSEKQ